MKSLFVSWLETLSDGPVDSRHFVLPTFCAVWREKLPTAELCTTSTSNWDHLTAHTEFGTRLQKWVGPGFSTNTEAFSAKKMSEVLPSHRRLCPHWPGLWEPPGGADDPTKSYCCRHYLPAPTSHVGLFICTFSYLLQRVQFELQFPKLELRDCCSYPMPFSLQHMYCFYTFLFLYLILSIICKLQPAR